MTPCEIICAIPKMIKIKFESNFIMISNDFNNLIIDMKLSLDHNYVRQKNPKVL
jgi:hypothetical protein